MQPPVYVFFCLRNILQSCADPPLRFWQQTCMYAKHANKNLRIWLVYRFIMVCLPNTTQLSTQASNCHKVNAIDSRKASSGPSCELVSHQRGIVMMTSQLKKTLKHVFVLWVGPSATQHYQQHNLQWSIIRIARWHSFWWCLLLFSWGIVDLVWRVIYTCHWGVDCVHSN